MIRLAIESDLSKINSIYNQAIRKGFITAHIRPLTIDERMVWFQNHNPEDTPIFVYEEDGCVRGWASFSSYRPGREALKEVAEISFYVDFDYHKQGIGSLLLDHCLQQATLLNKRILIAVIIEGNRGSMALLKKFGFGQWGFLPDVIHFRGEKRGQIYFGIRIKQDS